MDCLSCYSRLRGRCLKLPVMDIPFRFTRKQLSIATNGFSEASKLGWGVYRGVIPSGLGIAIKRVSVQSEQGKAYFLAEVDVLSGMRHKNIVNLRGWCSDGGEHFLVYDLVPKGNLHELLFGGQQDPRGQQVLSWEQRLPILRGVAAALAYLHDGYVQQVIHRDVKSSNVLLDDWYNAKLGGFELARKRDHSKSLTTTTVAGTVGYIAPEVLGTGKFTDKTDVYAFGVVALEVACGRRAVDRDGPQQDEEELILVDWVWTCHAQGDVLTAADPRLGARSAGFDKEMQKEVIHVLLIGLLCTHPDSKRRPSMKQVEIFLQGPVTLPPVPRVKPSTSRSASESST